MTKPKRCRFIVTDPNTKRKRLCKHSTNDIYCYIHTAHNHIVDNSIINDSVIDNNIIDDSVTDDSITYVPSILTNINNGTDSSTSNIISTPTVYDVPDIFRNTYYGKCCFCNDECNPMSQSCGRCIRSYYSYR